MSTHLERIGEKARKEPELVCTSLYHHVSDVDQLRACYDALPKDRAVGVDGVTKEAYGRNLEANLQDLSGRLKRMAYPPQPKRRSDLPKPGSEKGRPRGISCFEDTRVELAVKRVVEPIDETVVEDRRYGYRPERNPHTCVDELGRTRPQTRVSHGVEADSTSFFDTVNQAWMITCLHHRIGAPRMMRLLGRMLKGGILEDGLVEATEAGTPQGSILSPLLSNMYLHSGLDLWCSHNVRKQGRGEAYSCRFADDVLACVQYRNEAKACLQQLPERLGRFELTLAAEKTRGIEFGRFARASADTRGEKPKEVTCLGCTHDCGKTKEGYCKVKRRTSRKKLGQSLRTFADWACHARHRERKGERLRQAKVRVTGHLNYDASTDTSEPCRR